MAFYEYKYSIPTDEETFVSVMELNLHIALLELQHVDFGIKLFSIKWVFLGFFPNNKSLINVDTFTQII